MTSRHLGIFAVLLLLGLTAGPALAEVHVVQMTTVDFEPRFVPEEISVQPGDTVQWINADPFLLDHGVTSGTGAADPKAGELWDSGTVRSGEVFEHTFQDTGDFEYFSRPHEFAGMFGVIHVTNSLPVPEVKTSTWGKIKVQLGNILPRD
jgi:plastocyanin